MTVTPKIRYVCYNKTRHPVECDGQTGYTAKKLDAMVDEIIIRVFSQIKDIPTDELLSKRQTEIEEQLVQRALTSQGSAESRKYRGRGL